MTMMSSAANPSPAARKVLNDGERQKLNDGADAFFYNYPRICYHVDEGFLKHLTQLYRERIPAGGAVLDMMSSWVSHLPPEVIYSRVDGHGMNMEELGRNPRLDTKRVWDLNADPRLPFDDDTYDAVLCTVSVQYLQQPETVFADVRRVLKPGGVAIFSFSNRMFSDKAIKGWINRTGKGRSRLVSNYFAAAGGFSAAEVVEREASDSAGFFEGFSEMFGMVGRGDPFYAVPLLEHYALSNTPGTMARSVACGLAAGSALALQLSSLILSAEGHMFQMEPVCRQFYRTPIFQPWDYDKMEHCPSCYNAQGPDEIKKRAIAETDPAALAEYGGGDQWPLIISYNNGENAPNGNYLEPQAISARHGVCGDPGQRTPEAERPYSSPNSEWPILETYTRGQVIDIKVIISAYHWGHIEFNLCDAADLEDPVNGVVTQECFNMHPLDRAADDDFNSPVDTNYPGRYYVDPECRVAEVDQTKPSDHGAAGGQVAHMRYQLPAEVTCTRCILQMVHYTGNDCKHPGYDEFNPPSWPSTCAPNKSDWIATNRRLCGEEGSYPEEFWSCSDFAITEDGQPPETPAPFETSPPSDPVPCEDPADSYEQCGGTNWNGTECCAEGWDCTEMAPCYYQCRPYTGDSAPAPTPEERAPSPTNPPAPLIPECNQDWKQCGGGNWTGPTCCQAYSSCIVRNEALSPEQSPSLSSTQDTAVSPHSATAGGGRRAVRGRQMAPAQSAE
eukprot:g7780.t1